MMNTIPVVHQVYSVSSDLQESIPKSLFPTWPTILATVLAILILMLFLGKILFGSVKKGYEDRRKYIQNNIDEAEAMNDEALSDRQQANKELMEARSQAAQIVEDAKLRAEKVKSDELNKAKELTTRMSEKAQEEILREKEKFRRDSEQAIIEVALAAAAKVVEKEVDNKTNKKIIEDFIKAK